MFETVCDGDDGETECRREARTMCGEECQYVKGQEVCHEKVIC